MSFYMAYEPASEDRYDRVLDSCGEGSEHHDPTHVASVIKLPPPPCKHRGYMCRLPANHLGACIPEAVSLITIRNHNSNHNHNRNNHHGSTNQAPREPVQPRR